MDFEFVEVEQANPEEEMEEDPEAKEEDEEFAFPLFGGMTAEPADMMKVSLKEEEEEIIVNERPQEYYRAVYTDKERSEFAQSALTTEQIFADLLLPPIDTWPLKVLSVEVHNAQVEKEKKKRRRAGKKKRENQAECRERRQNREKQLKKERAAQYKKKFAPKGPWGGKGKGAKTIKKQAPKAAAPKFRTE